MSRLLCLSLELQERVDDKDEFDAVPRMQVHDIDSIWTGLDRCGPARLAHWRMLTMCLSVTIPRER